MNEQLQAELTKIITNVNNGTESAWSFINGQAPDVIQQLIVWYGVKSFLSFCIWIIFIIAGYIAVIKLFKLSKRLSDKEKERAKNKAYSHYDPFPYVAIWLVPLIIAATLTPIIITENITWLQIWIAPKVWVLEYVTSVVK